MRTISLICLTGMMMCLFFSVGTGQTFAWLTSETHATGAITNATANDLLYVTAEQTSCDEDSMNLKITLTNKSDVNIPIETDIYTGQIESGKSITKEVPKHTNESQINIQVSGFHGFIDDVFHVDIVNRCQ